jgi:phage regulator Rha-like protein
MSRQLKKSIIFQFQQDGCEILINKKSKNLFKISCQLVDRPMVLYRDAPDRTEADRLVEFFKQVIERRDELYPLGHSMGSCSCCGNNQ